MEGEWRGRPVWSARKHLPPHGGPLRPAPPPRWPTQTREPGPSSVPSPGVRGLCLGHAGPVAGPWEHSPIPQPARAALALSLRSPPSQPGPTAPSGSGRAEGDKWQLQFPPRKPGSLARGGSVGFLVPMSPGGRERWTGPRAGECPPLQAHGLAREGFSLFPGRVRRARRGPTPPRASRNPRFRLHGKWGL